MLRSDAASHHCLKGIREGDEDVRAGMDPGDGRMAEEDDPTGNTNGHRFRPFTWHEVTVKALKHPFTGRSV